METQNKILDCGHLPSEHGHYDVGYGIDINNKTYCYACCANQDKTTMRQNKRIVLYLNDTQGYVSNWPGSLKIKTTAQYIGRHNIAGTQTRIYFKFDDKFWTGIQYGNNTQLCYCKELKRQ